MLLYLFFILILMSSIKNLKKTILVYAPFKLFFNSNVLFISSPRFSFDAAVCLMFFLLWLIKGKNTNKDVFPLKYGFIFYGIAYVISCCYPEYAFSLIPDVIFGILLYCYMFFYSLSSNKDIKFVINTYMLFSFILCGNGLLQYFLHVNPLDDLIKSWAYSGTGYFSDNDLIRMGLQGRVRSFIPHAITYGVACLSIFMMYVYFFFVDNSFLNPKPYAIISVTLLLSGVILCGSRTPILGLIPFLFLYKYYLSYLRKSFIIFILIAFVGYFIFYDYISYTFMSLVDYKVSSEAGGSNLDMRMGQLALSWWMMMKAPFLGNGAFYDMQEVGGVEMFGAESVWFPIMAKKGLLGIVSYAYLYIAAFKVVRNMRNRIIVIVFIFSWLIMRTATSFVGLDDSMLFIFIFLFYKYELFNNKLNHSV